MASQQSAKDDTVLDIWIRTRFNEVFSAKFNSSDNLKDLKSAIETATTTNQNHVQVVWNGKVITDEDSTLAEIGLVSGDTVSYIFHCSACAAKRNAQPSDSLAVDGHHHSAEATSLDT